jgi:hypothetical protein
LLVLLSTALLTQLLLLQKSLLSLTLNSFKHQ